jgi:hypothetical protein
VLPAQQQQQALKVLPAGVVALSGAAAGSAYAVSAGPAGVAAQQPQQLPAAASVAMKQYLTTSFDDSDEF